ncbi:MAG: TerB family tellurite resistance protein, partial [gamma proteobacterium symbiont of Bathyaustriella thionipta]|nr:TerB family tellurite resistance protein [gamma proteobacterium symbiont of Bathyaustriella thionipta]
MLKAIKIFFEQHMTTELAADTQEHQLRLATAALLVEMMNQDEKVLEAEKQVVRQSLKDNFNLNDEESSELYQL